MVLECTTIIRAIMAVAHTTIVQTTMASRMATISPITAGRTVTAKATTIDHTAILSHTMVVHATCPVILVHMATLALHYVARVLLKRKNKTAKVTILTLLAIVSVPPAALRAFRLRVLALARK